MTFEPWKIYSNCTLKSLPIEEPPCKNCYYWNPQPVFEQSRQVRHHRNEQLFVGVILCQSSEMRFDFSCFKEKID